MWGGGELEMEMVGCLLVDECFTVWLPRVSRAGVVTTGAWKASVLACVRGLWLRPMRCGGEMGQGGRFGLKVSGLPLRLNR